MSLSALSVFALALLVDAGSPGPTVAALISRVLAHGFKDVLPFLAAIWLGEALWLTLTVAGLSAVAHAFGTIFLILRVAGVIYLFWLAWTVWHAPVDVAAEEPTGRKGAWNMFAAGLLVAVGNPKNMVFYLALLPTVLDLNHVGPVGWAELVVTMLVVLAGIDLSWSLTAVQARRFFANRRAMRAANRISASLMAGAATVVAVR